jgi:hypothetical protein
VDIVTNILKKNIFHFQPSYYYKNNKNKYNRYYFCYYYNINYILMTTIKTKINLYNYTHKYHIQIYYI